jgi:hypothetical protein
MGRPAGDALIPFTIFTLVSYESMVPFSVQAQISLRAFALELL